ncbi:hypothetical protein Q5424_28575 [Conexibacter sp. JD483]|uniref:hypothetical protein n=1 Tax=unclassified Conexibacter TaxID=2627773 RepID=UPI002724DFD6|nr:MULTISPECIES: hypothetical protein [unclassified Conexibacter]MDO8189584.1 hypothetical protein [Conexibacter sp. CPCC 205706]MDO8202128.1 hypothetical protein [Conexibacter sp. CPCC 205762]MDR9373087.1 hypothetical protein [Conexibacter sp. JD483]
MECISASGGLGDLPDTARGSGLSLRLARLARSAVSDEWAVQYLLDGGGRWKTTADGETVAGVCMAAQGDGRFEIVVHVAVVVVPIGRLVARLRRSVLQAAAREGLADEIAAVVFSFDHFVTPETRKRTR